MINPLSVATRGRTGISSKKTLTIATIGWLIIIDDPLEPPIRDNGGGKKRVGQIRYEVDYNDKELKKRIEKNNKDMIMISIMFVKYLT